MSKYALVLGASGVSGWSMTNELLHDYPRPGVWGGIVALTNRPLPLERSNWPTDDKRLSVVSGIDLLKGSLEDVEATIKTKVPHLDRITDIFHLAYKANKDLAQETAENVEMLKRAVVVLDRLCPKLENVVLQTGAKHYGCQLLSNRPAELVPPFTESTPPLSGPAAFGIFYIPQMDFLAEYSRDKSWSCIDTRPDIIVGFVPNENFYSLGSSLGFFLALYRSIHGAGADCPFPGTAASWLTKSNDAGAEMIARQTIAISLSDRYRGKAKGDAFNVADERTPRTWETRWPDLCALFGLKGVKLEQDNPIEVRAYIQEHIKEWEAIETKYGLQQGFADHARIVPGFEYSLISLFVQDRHYDMSKIYGPEGIGFTEERNTTESWGRVFEHMRTAKILPPLE